MSRRAYVYRMAALGCLLALVQGCASSVDGTPLAEPASATATPAPVIDYAIPLTAAEKEKLSLLATWRSWDPCGLIDTTVLKSLGAPSDEVKIDGSEQLDACYGDFAYSSDAPDWDITVRIATTAGSDGVPTTLGDANVLIDEPKTAREGCSYLLPMSVIDQYVKVQADWRDTDPAPSPVCEVAKKMATAALPLLKSPPLRKDVHSSPDTPLALADPCAGIEGLSKTHTVQLSFTSTRMHRCALRLDKDVSVSVSIDVDRDRTTSSSLSADESVATVGKFTGVRRTGTSSCSISVAVGDPLVGTSTSSHSAPDFAHINVSAGTCPLADEVLLTTTAALKL